MLIGSPSAGQLPRSISPGAAQTPRRRRTDDVRPHIGQSGKHRGGAMGSKSTPASRIYMTITLIPPSFVQLTTVVRLDTTLRMGAAVSVRREVLLRRG